MRAKQTRAAEVAFEAFEPFEYPVDRNPARAYVGKMAAGESRRTTRQSLQILARLAVGDRIRWWEFPWHELRPQHTDAIRALLANAFTPAGANLRRVHLRGVIRQAWRLEWLDVETYQKAADLEPIRGNSQERGRQVSRAEIRAVLRALPHDLAGARDRAILWTLYRTGVRRAELVGLNLSSVDLEAGVVRVRGKGQKFREIDLVGQVVKPLEAWLAERGRRAGPLFVPIDRWGSLCWRRMTPGAIALILDRRSAAAQVERFTPHDLRRTLTSELLATGADLPLVSRILGHSDPRTTAGYDRRPASARRRAIERLER